MVQVLSVNHRNGKLALINLHSVRSGDGGEPVQVLLYYNDGMEGIGPWSGNVGYCDLIEDIKISTIYLA